MKNTITWFEIAAKDYVRASKFYGTILGVEIEEADFETHHHKYGLLQLNDEGVRGAIVEGPDYEPCHKGALVYLNAENRLDEILSKIEDAGGKVITKRTRIGNNLGSYAIFMDTEGNKVGLYTPEE